MSLIDELHRFSLFFDNKTQLPPIPSRYLSYNSFTGSLPDGLSNLPSIQEL